MPRLASPPVNAIGSTSRRRRAAAGDASCGNAPNSGLISGRTVGLRIAGPRQGPLLFRCDRVQERGSVIVMPDQGGEVVAVGLEGDRLFVDIEVDVLEGPVSKLAIPKAGLQTAIRLGE